MHLHLPPRKASLALASWPVPFSKSSVSFKRLGVEFAQKPRGSGLELCLLDKSLLVVFGEQSSFAATNAEICTFGFCMSVLVSLLVSFLRGVFGSQVRLPAKSSQYIARGKGEVHLQRSLSRFL